MNDKPPIFALAPGYVAIALADLQALMNGTRPREMPDHYRVRAIWHGREIYCFSHMAVPFGVTCINVVPGAARNSGDNDTYALRLEISPEWRV